MSAKTFKGHGIYPMYYNIILALIPVISLGLINLQPETEIIAYRYLLFLFIWHIPFPTYLFFEIKHLLFKDGIADDGSLSSILVFGGQSLFGLALQVITIVFFLKLNILGAPSQGLIILLSFIASFGACLGLTDLPLLFIIFPGEVLRHSLILLKSWRLILVCVSTTILLSFLASLFISL